MRATAPQLSPAQLAGVARVVPIITKVVPTNGQTVNVTIGSIDSSLLLSPAGALATLTVAFPSDANSSLGDLVYIGTTQLLTIISLTGTTLIAAIVTLAANTMVTYKKVDVDTWMRVI